MVEQRCLVSSVLKHYKNLEVKGKYSDFVYYSYKYFYCLWVNATTMKGRCRD